ncbi:MAG: ATP phosphoribosyltransferase [Phycisphaerales bacterium JB037]
MTVPNAQAAERRQPSSADPAGIHLALPKGRMEKGVLALLAEAGIRVENTARGYRPRINLPGYETKVLKPQAIVEMLAAGSRDVGFAGADWVAEMNADLVELLDTGLDRVKIVAAAPPDLLVNNRPAKPSFVVASELEKLTLDWIADRDLDARFLRSYGATEVLPPEDCDCIVDIAASGATLRANNLVVFDELMTSSTRLYASRAAMGDPAKRARLEELTMLLASVLEARRRVVLEVNVAPDRLDGLVESLPCMREPTIATLRGDAGFAIKVAVLRDQLPALIPQIRALGGTDILVTQPSQIVP